MSNTFTQAEENYYVNTGLSELFPDEIKKLKLEGNIVLGDFIFNTIDEDGVVWVISEINGWWQSPSADVPEIDRSAGDGGYDVPGRYMSRSIEIEGSFLVTDPSKVEAARDKLIEACNLVYQGAWLKTGSSPIRASYVYMVDQIETQVVNARGRTEFTIPLRASDPIKYLWNDEDPDGYEVFEIPVKNSATGATGARTLTNVGNYSVPCFLEIVGPYAAPGTIFNQTTEGLVIITQPLRGISARSVVNKELTFNVDTLIDTATLTTTSEHSFRVGDTVLISNVGAEFDGEQVITSTPTSTTFTYNTVAASIAPVTFKTLQSDEAQLETTVAHGYSVGDSVVVRGVDATFDGTYTITATPSSRLIKYARKRTPTKNIVSTSLASNIATISTSDPHEFIVGEDVTISGTGINYDGEYEILSTPTENSFTCAITRTNSRAVTNKAMSGDTVTLTTSSPHGFVVDEPINVTDVDLSLNGGYFLSGVTSNTFSYRRARSTQREVTITARGANQATLTTSTPHGFAEGEKIKIEGVDETYNGTYTIINLPSITTFTFSSTGGDLVSTSVVDGRVRAFSRKIDTIARIGNLVTVTTDNIHGVIFGEQVTITGYPAFNGTYTVSDIPFLNTFEFESVGANIEAFTPLIVTQRKRSATTATLTTELNHGLTTGDKIRVFGVGFNFDGLHTITATPSVKQIRFTQEAGLEETPEEDSGGFVGLDYGYVELPGSITSAVVSPAGLVRASGSLPFTSTTGVSTVSDAITRRQAAGNAIKENNVKFTPGLSSASAIVDADILEIDTKNKEVAFNGEISGARGRVDVLADFIQLAPGENIIEFEDTGNPEGTATLKIFYRSGWLS